MQIRKIFIAVVVCCAGLKAQATSVSEVETSGATGLEALDSATRDQVVGWAKDYARYRRLPLSGSAQEFLMNCQREDGQNVFCKYAQEPPVEKTPATSLEQRQKFFKAVASLDSSKAHTRACHAAIKQLESLVSDPAAARLHARSLYWLYICSKQTKNAAKAKLYADQLWERFPFDHHTILVMQDRHDERPEKMAHDESNLSVLLRSAHTDSPLNKVIAGLEALHQIGEDGAAAVIAKRAQADLETLEPEVQMYVGVLMERVSRAIPSVLPVSRSLIPLLRDHKEMRNAQTLKMLFPDDYAWFDSHLGKPVLSRELVQEYAKDVPSHYLKGLIYYESALNPRASSGANAFGLLQLLLVSANEQYQQITKDKNAKVTSSQLYDPSLSLTLGSRYLAALKYDFHGSWPLALASYNAGATAVRNWLEKHKQITDAQVQADLIFMNEKREIHVSDYISSVLGKADWYQVLYQ